MFDDLSGTETITYTNVSSTPDSGGGINLGNFQVSFTGTGSGNAFGADFSIAFTSPPGTTGNLAAALSGNFVALQPAATVLFSSNTQTFSSPDGDFEVAVQTAPLQLNPNETVAPPGNVADVPEPTPFRLFLGSIAGVTLVVLRCRTKTA